ncbi:MAG: GPR endopeptidase [Clostridium sp.]|nr:GPR endopeptidase [Clostridium sp.]
MKNIRTDLALEANEMHRGQKKCDIEGVKVIERIEEGVKITTVKVLNEIAEKTLGKSKGDYITIDIPEFTVYDGKLMESVSNVFGKFLKDMLKVKNNDLVLVVGLGNKSVTPDALGPKVVEKLMITRHLRDVMPDVIDDSVVSVSAIAPGVLGITGIETLEIIKSLVDKIKPQLVICIDALAARKTQRVNRTIQISDTGISPGSGVHNHRKSISYDTLGVKVISIGVPTVVDASTIANDTMDLLLDKMIEQSKKGKEFYNMLKEINDDDREVLIREILYPQLGDFLVTPKEIDVMIESLSKIIANGVNIALQPNMTVEEINNFLN